MFSGNFWDWVKVLSFTSLLNQSLHTNRAFLILLIKTMLFWCCLIRPAVFRTKRTSKICWIHPSSHPETNSSPRKKELRLPTILRLLTSKVVKPSWSLTSRILPISRNLCMILKPRKNPTFLTKAMLSKPEWARSVCTFFL